MILILLIEKDVDIQSYAIRSISLLHDSLFRSKFDV